MLRAPPPIGKSHPQAVRLCTGCHGFGQALLPVVHAGTQHKRVKGSQAARSLAPPRRRRQVPTAQNQRSVTLLVVVRAPWLIRSVILAPLSCFRRLRAAAVSRSLTSPCRRRAVRDPVAMTTGLPLRPIALAGNGRRDRDLARRGDLDLDARPGRQRLRGDLRRERDDRRAAARPPRRRAARGRRRRRGRGAGRNAATFGAADRGCAPVGEITTGGDVITQGSAVARRSARRPSGRWRRSTRSRRASCESDGSVGDAAAGHEAVHAAGNSALVDPLDREHADLADRLRPAVPLLEPERRQPPVGRDVGAGEVQPDARGVEPRGEVRPVGRAGASWTLTRRRPSARSPGCRTASGPVWPEMSIGSSGLLVTGRT